MDLFSRQIIGYAMSKSLHRQVVIDAYKMAVGQRTVTEGLMHHSDRGSQYASKDYQDLLQDAGMVCSLSRKGNCWDNAPVAAFFSTLKTELVYHRRYQTREEARADIFEYIAVWYNRKRRHSSIGYLSPVKYEEQYYNQFFGNVA